MKKTLAIMAAIGIMVCSCSSDGPSDAQNGDNQETKFNFLTLSAAEQAAAEASKSFQYRFFNTANELADPDENVLVSPLSARIVLSLLANATSPEGCDEITKVLGCDDVDALNSLGHSLITQLPDMDGRVSLSLAQSVWYDRHYTLAPNFADVATNIYNVDLFPRDMSNESAMLSDINRWCSDRTGGQIPKYMNQYHKLVVLLANAMYFKAQWQIGNKFDASKTNEETFHGASRDSKIMMMHSKSRGTYVYSDDFSGIYRPFGNAYAMQGFHIYFIMPDEGTSIEELAADPLILERADYAERDINLGLPKFSLTSGKKDLDETLKAMGINRIFYIDHQRIFSHGPSEFYWHTNQGATVKIDEEGAIATAVTFAEGLDGALPPPSPVETINITFDRPFLFFVTENSTGSVLLAGKVMNL